MLKYFATVLGSTNNLLALERAELRRALDAFHAEIGGKLIYVHALPGLPVDGILRSAFEYKGIYIRKHFNHLNNDADDFCELLLGEGLATIHFSLNAHVDDYFYLEHPFVVLIPANSDLLLQTTSMSFSEVIILGDYKLPSDAVVMVRESNKNQVPDYYHKNHKVVVFNDGVSSPSEYYHDLNKKRAAVDNVVAELGGAKLNMQGDFWCSLKVIDHSGRNINTPEILKGLFAKRAISFGVHNYTRQDSCGEQWRDFYTTTHSSIYIVFRGDLGFSIEAYHSAKLNDWLKKLLVPADYMQAHLKRNKYNLICLRAMDFIFDHFREKKLARKYISSHLKEHLVELEKSGLFNVERGLFPESLLEAKTVDELAKIICDYDYLKHQKRGETFDLITSKQLMAHLVEHLFSMNPIEARNFLITYFEKSSFVAAFLPHERSDMLQNLQNMYVLLYSNCPYVSEKMFNNYAPILTEMLDLDEFKIDKSREDWEWCHLILFYLHSWNVIETADGEITDALLQSILKQLFDKTVTRLAKYAPDPSVGSTRAALIFSAMAVGVISATPYIVEYTQEAYRRYTSQHP